MICALAAKTLVGWNERVLTETDFLAVCEEHGFHYIETPLIDAAGAYVVHRGHDFILIHPAVAPAYRGWVQFHELGHAILHQPGEFSTAAHRRLDWQANVIAAVALLPQNVFTRFSFDELAEAYDYPPELLAYRLKVYERMKI